jgi:predicted nucleic acid-binding protein
MRTALDANILSALWSKEHSAAAISKCLGEAKENGSILIAGVVYAELLAFPNATEAFINEFCNRTGVMIDFEFRQAAWVEAGLRFAKYAKRRRRAKDSPKRLLADFLVGAHALLQADCLLTLDPHRFNVDFPELRLVEVT